MLHFQQLIRKLDEFWQKQGCILQQGYDLEVGAGTFNPATFLRCLGPEPYQAAYLEPSRRPSDGRYGQNPNRLQHFFQYQVIIKPSPLNIQDLYVESLRALGLNLDQHDLRFVHDDWEAPTLAAWGLGWEVWLDGMEITQFTYFQMVGGLSLKPITVEITYGIERLAMYLQGVSSIFDLQWNEHFTYGEIYQRNEIEWSHYNFEEANTKMWWQHFEDFETESKRLIEKKLPLPAYDFVMKASHAFNILDARGVISVSERAGYIVRIRQMASSIAQSFVKSREELGFPLLKESERKALPKVKAPAQITQESDFLLEIGSEELPAAFIPQAIARLKTALMKLFNEQKISFESIDIFATPRRLAVLTKKLAASTTAEQIEKKGPSVLAAFDEKGHARAAAKGFFGSFESPVLNLDEIKSKKDERFSIESIKGQDYVFARTLKESRSSASILQEKLPSLIEELDFPKKMRWADYNVSYARPLRWIVALFGSECIEFRIADIISGKTSYGHSQIKAEAFELKEACSYAQRLKEYFVMANVEERKKAILAQLENIENQENAIALEKERVLEEVVHLVEWPKLIAASFDAEFLKAPAEVLVSEMVEHQKYFPLARKIAKNEKKDVKELLPRFVICANKELAEDASKVVVDGNLRVLSARLSDGVFLFEQDAKNPLEYFAEKLKKVSFISKLGSLLDKTKRLKQFSKIINEELQIADEKKLFRAAHLCKADLSSSLVHEFPGLQGVVGRLYAQKQAEDEEVASAIEEHWSHGVPQKPVSLVLSLADKMDNLIACFASDRQPSSSSDPYALRRQSLSIVRSLVDGKHSLALSDLLKNLYEKFHQSLDSHDTLLEKEQGLKNLNEYFLNRIKTIFAEYGLEKDEVQASLSSGFNDVYDLYLRAKALHETRKESSFQALYEVYKRAKGQLAKDKNQKTFSEKLLKEETEKTLHRELLKTQKLVAASIAKKDYQKAYQEMSTLQIHLSDLFDNLRILCPEEEIKNNRLSLLRLVFKLFEELLDFSKLQT